MRERLFWACWLVTAGICFNLWRLDSLQAAPRASEQTIQVKLRDLLDMVPRKDAAETNLHLKAIEARLAAIEGLLKAAPVPLPAPVPSTGTRQP